MPSAPDTCRYRDAQRLFPEHAARHTYCLIACAPTAASEGDDDEEMGGLGPWGALKKEEAYVNVVVTVTCKMM
jgi:hypothetical protein